MTAEVAVLNASGVALAADSAVTVGAGKTYNSALKLFALSKTEPVGVMVYGGSSLVGVPWETIIKVFRKELGSKSCDTLHGYSDAFMRFLDENTGLFPSEAQEAWLEHNVRNYYTHIRSEFYDRVESEFGRTGHMGGATAMGLMREVIDQHYSRLSGMPYLDGLDQSFERRISKQHLKLIGRVQQEILPEIPPTADIPSKLGSIAAMLHSKVGFIGEHSGIVVAGFGTKDLYPCVETNHVDGVVCGRVRKKQVGSESGAASYSNEARIIPFAQDDMVVSFMEGMNPVVRAFLNGCMENLFQGILQLIDRDSLRGNDASKDKVLAKYGDEINNLFGKFLVDLDTHIVQKHVQPVMQMVAALPKDGLAEMAESLVSLTALKRRVGRSMETVGGPIDVAVISKGDGFVWIKRKHYFPKELNHQFFANYHQGRHDAPGKKGGN